MKFRKLRIAWSVAWGVAATLLIAFVLYTGRHQVVALGWISKSHIVRCTAFKQWAQLYVANFNREWPPHLRSNYIENPAPDYAPMRSWYVGRGIEPGSMAELRCSLWVFVLASVFVGALPWTSYVLNVRRFSLRTLLIATALVAVVLGAVMYCTR